ncbi:hypothetical protein [Streptomyces sp. NPDC003090]|uniref:hypothetical protein n=1 Tax=Streptomyces sp. NPDC003090 TaxID=3154274 RepID=UPI00381674C7
MTFIEPGLYVRNAFAEGPLADAALSRAPRAAQLLDALQGQAPTMTDGQLHDGGHRALRRCTQEQPPTCQVDSITALIRRGVRIDWPASDRAMPAPLPRQALPARRGSRLCDPPTRICRLRSRGHTVGTGRPVPCQARKERTSRWTNSRASARSPVRSASAVHHGADHVLAGRAFSSIEEMDAAFAARVSQRRVQIHKTHQEASAGAAGSYTLRPPAARPTAPGPPAAEQRAR